MKLNRGALHHSKAQLCWIMTGSVNSKGKSAAHSTHRVPAVNDTLDRPLYGIPAAGVVDVDILKEGGRLGRVFSS